MEIARTVVLLLRRPWVLVPVLVLALGMGAVAFALVPPRYESKAIVVLTTPAAGSGAVKRIAANPLLDFGETLKTATTVTVQAMGTLDVASQLGAGKNSPNSFTVTDAENTAELFGATGPFLMIKSVSTASPEAAFQTTQLVGEYMRTQLAERQRALEAPRSSYIVVTDVVPPTAPEEDYSLKLKIVGAALLLGLLLGIGFAYVVHRLVERSRRDPDDEPDGTVNGQGRAVAPGVPSRSLPLPGQAT